MRKNQSREEIAIRVELAKRCMSIEDLAHAVGVSRGYIYDFLHGARKGYKLREKIYEYLGMDLKDCDYL